MDHLFFTDSMVSFYIDVDIIDSNQQVIFKIGSNENTVELLKVLNH